MVYCNNGKCEYNCNQKCSKENIYYVDKLCMTFRRKVDTRELMHQPFKARCHRSGGKYKSDSVRTLK